MKDILTVRDLSIEISNLMLMQNISFNVCEGEVVLLSGANGIGKSTLLKAIMGLETAGKHLQGSIVFKGFSNILALSPEEIQRFRSKIAYVQQKDDFSELGNVRVRDIISDSAQSFSGKALNDSEVNDLIDEWIPKRRDGKRVFDAKSKPTRFSGGEQRLLSVLSIIATRPTADLLIVDEPLNNLDFDNARNISNILNRVIKANPHMGMLMISHCRIFPFITREIELMPDGIAPVQDRYTCHSCFGKPDENGYYV